MKLPRPPGLRRRIPLCWWYYGAWIDGGRKARRPKCMPRRVPAGFWLWRTYRLALDKGQGSRQWNRYLKRLANQPDPDSHAALARAALVHWALWGINHNSQIHYTEDTRRDDYLHGQRGHLPFWTDCSGFVTYCYWASGLPDPSGLNYRYLGFTGTLLSNAYKHGRVFSDVSRAKRGDPIVVGPGTGWHTFIVIEEGKDPTVASHGSEPGPLSEKCSYDRRAPKRVCQILP